MKLRDFLKDEKPTAWARKAGIPIPVITRFLKGERKLHPNTMKKIVEYTNGSVTYSDLIEEMSN